jgi:hypothetical protein
MFIVVGVASLFLIRPPAAASLPAHLSIPAEVWYEFTAI